MKALRLFLPLLLVFCLVACSSAPVGQTNSSTKESVTEQPQQESKEDTRNGSDAAEKSTSKILIAYFSRTGENYQVGDISEGNTAKVAKEIAAQTGGELFEIRTVKSYPDSYDECLDVAKEEQSNNARPELTQTVDDISSYDEIYLGYPIWWADMPMAVYTFLESYDFTGKTIHPFNTHEGSGNAGTASKIESACPGVTVTESLAIQGKTAQESPDEVSSAVAGWLK